MTGPLEPPVLVMPPLTLGLKVGEHLEGETPEGPHPKESPTKQVTLMAVWVQTVDTLPHLATPTQAWHPPLAILEISVTKTGPKHHSRIIVLTPSHGNLLC